MRTPTTKSVSVAAAAAFLALFSAAAAAETKIASVRGQEVLLQSPQFKTMQDKLTQEFEKRKKDFETDGKKFQGDVEKFNKEKDLLSASDRAKQEKDLGTRQLDLGYKQRQLQEDFQNRREQLEKDVQTKVRAVILQISKEKGLDLVVLDPLYASDAMDITDEVLKKLQPAGK